jgi:O-antigen/teichoic acid export membrane protein
MTAVLKAARLGGRPSTQVVGAVAGQLSQAFGSFVLQVIAARALGAAGLGVFALLYGLILVTTAISSGLVGDSLTVLDRGRPDIRSALLSWGLVVSGTAGLVGGMLFWVSGIISGLAAALFALTVATFMLESILRRLLMATMRFWFLVLVDLVGLAASLAVLIIWQAVGSVSLTAILVAWVVGQVVGSVVAVGCLPRAERHLGPWRRPAMGQVAAFGSWRAAQQTVRPSTLAAARFLLTIAVGRALFGQLEAARVYMAPALLLVGGLGSYLFSSYALKRATAVRDLIRRADRAAAVMLVVTLALGGLATLASPWAGPLVTGSSFSMVPLAVFGWAVYAASSAAVMPYASLAAVRGRQRVVMLVRTSDAAVSLVVLAVLVFPGHLDVSWAPYELAAGSFLGAGLIRRFVLEPLRHLENSAEPRPEARQITAT